MVVTALQDGAMWPSLWWKTANTVPVFFMRIKSVSYGLRYARLKESRKHFPASTSATILVRPPLIIDWEMVPGSGFL